MSETMGWREWVDSLNGDGAAATLGEAVRRFAYDMIEHGGDMGPSGNVCHGIDEGMVMTCGFFKSFEDEVVSLAAEEMERKAGSCLERMAVRYARKPTSARFEALADAVRRAEGGDAR
ncbi:MAG: hypothetical protein SOW20_07850 [Berryella intestinalis]|uniref:hypothetical protein n=1 Tax=Berryella intestinalis TaxID=1531429 RepID=UPI002A754560|nr:hypothetical protein [Berryella intestinalis]MDY3129917.1 hypothetical protein [Berryella intestinalis]